MTEPTPTGTAQAGGIWAIVGKLGMIAALLWTLGQLYTRFWARDTVLQASGEYTHFEVPKKHLDDLRELERAIEPWALKEVFGTLDDDRADKLKAVFPKALQETLTCTRAICRIALLNAGSKQVDDLVLEVPFGGIAVVSRIGEPPEIVRFDSKIRVGALRPSNEVHCVLWSYFSSISSYDEEKIKFTHSAGVVPVAFSRRLRGIPAWVGDNFWFLVFMTLVFALLILLFIARSMENQATPETTVSHGDAKQIDPNGGTKKTA